MTAEVVIMNQHAVVLAADSATTVDTWVNGEKETRYFKGANKLFQLSAAHPVGGMIYGSATLHDVPWELVVKDFRKELRATAHHRLATYATEFFEFVQKHTGLFPESYREEILKSKLRLSALVFAGWVTRLEPFRALTNDAERNAFFQERVARREAFLDRQPSNFASQAEVDAAVAKNLDWLTAEVAASRQTWNVEFVDPLEQWVRIAIKDVFKEPDTYETPTGVVIAGFGDRDYYPAFEAYQCLGFLGTKLLAKREDISTALTNERTADVTPFATKSMINTFRMGISPDVYGSVVEATESVLKSFAATILAKLKGTIPDDELSAMVEQAVEQHEDTWFQRSRENHFAPLRRVVASLPITDMASLAKSLIELQSLKEKVTSPSESVSGPVEVAVISKHDGFIWIERKHYFRPELNPRFFSRQHWDLQRDPG